MKTEIRTVLVGIERAWGGERNIGNFNVDEISCLENLLETGDVIIKKENGNTWASLTTQGRDLLFRLNSERDVVKWL